MSGKVKAFAELGVSLRNDRWSWSGKTTDGTTVVLQLWKDRLNYKTKPISYSDFDDPLLPKWINLPGNRERIENLKWEQEHCDNKFRVVIGVAKDVTSETRETAEAYAKRNMVMKIVEFDQNSGEFRAELAEGS